MNDPKDERISELEKENQRLRDQLKRMADMCKKLGTEGDLVLAGYRPVIPKG